MKSYAELKALIEQRGVHPEFGDAGEGFAIEQNPHELATFLVRMQELGVQSCLEIGTGYKGGLSRFLAADMGWEVTSVDVNNYHHVYEGVHYVIGNLVDFGSQRFDLVFIDGAHDMQHVEGDFEHYSNYFRKVLAFHDIAGLRDCGDVKILWERIVRDGQHAPETFHTIVDDEKQSGIGWIEL